MTDEQRSAYRYILGCFIVWREAIEKAHRHDPAELRRQRQRMDEAYRQLEALRPAEAEQERLL